MTCRLSQQHPIDVLYGRAKKYPGGIEALAHRMDVSAKLLYNKLERNCETHHLREDEFEQILRLLVAAKVPDAYAPLRALCLRFDHVAVQLPEVKDGAASELSAHAVKLLAESGDVARDIHDGLANDGVIDAAEAARLDKDIDDVVAVMLSLKETVKRIQQPARKAQIKAVA
jgi:hypothetical protein